MRSSLYIAVVIVVLLMTVPGVAAQQETPEQFQSHATLYPLLALPPRPEPPAGSCGLPGSDGLIALTLQHRLCICDEAAKQWVNDGDGATCRWGKR